MTGTDGVRALLGTSFSTLVKPRKNCKKSGTLGGCFNITPCSSAACSCARSINDALAQISPTKAATQDRSRLYDTLM